MTVGTDHHPFDRLVRWADRWAAQHPDDDVVVQHGATAAPSVAAGQPFFAHDDLQHQMDAADVVVTHGGPATVTEARRRRKVPVCVPRDPRLGEHVDDHQQRFAHYLSRQGLVRVVRDEEQLAAALAHSSALRVDSAPDQPPAGVAEVGRLVRDLVDQRRRSRGNAAAR